MLNKPVGKITVAALVLASLATGGTLHAQELSKNPDLKDSNIVITVNRSAQEKKIVSDAVEVLTAKDLEKAGATNLYEALKYVEGLNTNFTGRTGNNLKIRGMNSNHTLVLINGQRTAGEDVVETQNVYAFDRIPLGNVERVEIIKGAASAQYGSDALGGVINIITKDSSEASSTLTMATGTKASMANYHLALGEHGKFSGDLNLNFGHNNRINNGKDSYLFYGNKGGIDFSGKYKIGNYNDIRFTVGYYKENTKSEVPDRKRSMGGRPTSAPGSNHGGKPAGVGNGNHSGAPAGVVGGNAGGMPNGMANGMPGAKPANMPNGAGHGGTANGAMPPEIAKMLKEMAAGAKNNEAKYVRKDQVTKYNNEKFDTTLSYNGQTDKSIYSIKTFYSQLKKKQEVFNNPNFTKAEIDRYNQMMAPAIAQGMPKLFTYKYDWDDLKYTMYGVEATNNVQADDKHTITYGTEVRKSKIEGTRVGGDHVHKVSQSGNGETVERNYGQDDLTNMAFYFQDQFQADAKTNIVMGLRYDHDSYFGGKFTPRTGIVYNFNDNHRLKANFGTAFKAPTLSELYMDRVHTEGGTYFRIIGNEKLKPEESINWDLSYEAEFGKNKNSYGKLTYFNNRVKNLISHHAIATSPELVFQYYNVGRAKINGVELSLGTALNDKWSAKLSYDWLNARNAQNDQFLDNNARNTGTLQFSYDDNEAKGWSGSIAANLKRKYKFNATPDKVGTDAKNYTYTSVDVVVNKKLGQGRYAFFALDNVFNVKRNDLGVTGRLWRVGTQWTF